VHSFTNYFEAVFTFFYSLTNDGALTLLLMIGRLTIPIFVLYLLAYILTVYTMGAAPTTSNTKSKVLLYSL